MASITEHDVSYADGAKNIRYLAAGPNSGPLIIFLHGWPAVALTWKHQLLTFASLGFRAIAPDMPGWGKSAARHVTTDYTQEALVEGMLALLSASGRSAAVWVAHDWGAGVASSLAAHHPAVVQALVLLCVPYRSIEMGLDHLVSFVDRTIYPEDEYPYGQWDYMAYYEEAFEECVKSFEANVPGFCQWVYARPPEPNGYSAADAFKPAATASIRKNRGKFGGSSAPVADTLPAPLLEGEVFDAFVGATEKTGLWGGSAYYMNHKANVVYNSQAPGGGKLGRDKPVLFIHARFDFVCATLTTRIVDPMREACENLTEVTIEAGHNVHFEKPEEVNGAVARFLVGEAKEIWPGYADSGYRKVNA
ncbi:putative epoxide hydrolase [Diaporthe sp. PMI_573]|nr:putative epoxide hydrolase [Diaporthaceae sp. PMI_573]